MEIIYSKLKQLDRATFHALPTEVEKEQKFKEYYLDLSTELGKGSRVVERALKELFPPADPLNKYIPHLNTLQRHIQKDKSDKPYDLEKAKADQPQLYPYLKQLQLINDAIFSTDKEVKHVPITGSFVKHAERCLYRFNDPLGEKVDLLAQWCIVREFYLRDRVSNPITKDLDAILDYTTWLDTNPEPSMKRPLSPYEFAVRNDGELVPKIIHAMPVGEIVDGRFEGKVNKGNRWQMTIYAHLRLPFQIIFIDKKQNVIMAASNQTPEERDRTGIQSPEQLRQIPIAKGMIANHIRQQQSLVDHK